MVKLGIDIGAQNVKAVIVDNGRILAFAKVPKGFNPKTSAENVIEQVLQKSGVIRQELSQIIATGSGSDWISDIATTQINDFLSAARGAFFLFPLCRTVIDAGAEEVRVVKLDDKGSIRDYVRNDRCAAGAGVFIEAMARALKVSLDEFVKLPLASTKEVPINAQCCVFAESEVVSLVHSGFVSEDISKAIHDAIAERIAALARRVRLEREVILIGGMGYNISFIRTLERVLDTSIVVPAEPEYVSAIGAAVYS